jgi:AmmeMemoRadiSam system protein B
MRQPAVAGYFYESRKDALLKSIERAFLSPLGPGRLPSPPPGSSRRVRGLVVPHAGYRYSGHIAAHAYLALWEDGLPEITVVIGPNHYGTSFMALLSDEDYLTPLGTVRVDRQISDRLRGGFFDYDMQAQSQEHSIEVQLPFLQYLKPDISFVPVCMGIQEYGFASQVGERLRETLEGRDYVVIASTDFSHYVPEKVAREKDMKAIQRILECDAKGLYDTVVSEDISMCGYGPVIAMLSCIRPHKAEMLSYGHSGQVESMKEVVGYCSIRLY